MISRPGSAAPPPVELASGSFDEYACSLIHRWSKTLTAIGVTLVPIFFILDFFMMPPELLTRFAGYRVVAIVLVVCQFLLVWRTQPSRTSFLHGYTFSVVVGGMIALMTSSLGGFNSTYYAGLNLVMIAANLLVPWRVVHSAVNSLMIIALYVAVNVFLPSEEPTSRLILVNNLYFLLSTAVISVAITWLKQGLIRQEFSARTELQRARDALFGEMEVAKRIQTSLLPKTGPLRGYEVAASMLPAEEVGGDFYDVIQTDVGETWIMIGDVSGHGVESGLIMMMAQTSLFTTVNRTRNMSPAKALKRVNAVLAENLARMGTDRYMTVSALALRDGAMIFAGKHQDIFVLRAASGTVESIPTTGAWLGLLPDLEGYLEDTRVELSEGDVVLLFTDGVTEAMSASGQMFGEERLRDALSAHGHLPVDEIVRRLIADVQSYMQRQDDDLTLVAFKRVTPTPKRQP